MFTKRFNFFRWFFSNFFAFFFSGKRFFDFSLFTEKFRFRTFGRGFGGDQSFKDGASFFSRPLDEGPEQFGK